jgi:hypothetical protein
MWARRAEGVMEGVRDSAEGWEVGGTTAVGAGWGWQAERRVRSIGSKSDRHFMPEV